MLLTAGDAKRLFSRIRERATRGRSLLTKIINKAGTQRPTATTIQLINREFADLLRVCKEISQILDHMA